MTLSFGGGAGVLTIPGLISDGADGITVTGAINAGTVGANGGVFPDFFGFTGSIDIEDSAGTNPDGDTVFSVNQRQGWSVDHSAPMVYFSRRSNRNGHANSAPAILILDSTGGYPNIIEISGTPGSTIRVGEAGGIGLFGHAAPLSAASITGALSAVTDAAAKTVLTTIIAALIADGGATDDTT